MKFRLFASFLIIMILSLLLMSCGEKSDQSDSSPSQTKIETPPTSSDSQESTEGPLYSVSRDFDILDPEYDVENPDKVVVYEFFGYTCPHCFHFEPFIEPWKLSKPDYVEFNPVPLNFHPSWSIYQQAYITAKSMGVAEQAHAELFKAIHEQNKRFSSIEDLAAWYADETGIDKDEFISTADSFIIDDNQRKADKLGFQMQITGTPTVVVDGKYKISNKEDRQEEINVLNFLIEKRAKEKGIISE